MRSTVRSAPLDRATDRREPPRRLRHRPAHSRMRPCRA
jgi:hypothetical protein